ncbi:MAG: stage V sporulation protein AC [Ruminococcus sp.]|nr:stage V sporulation protein AC [Ruminococcus sp.]MCD7727132.1 stage V sporulation protein AC [Ruminococcus sp.]MCD8328765.1 stage V sporulation protein AC [Ruminococcus sp.]
MNMSKKDYDKIVKEASPPTKSYKTIPCAFLIGGLICTLGEGLLNLWQYLDFSEKTAGALTSICLVFLSALFTGLGLYPKIAKLGGAGTLVPITGFANSVVSPAIEFKTEGYVLGLGAKIFIIAGPVILYGTVAAFIYGIIYWLLTSLF